MDNLINQQELIVIDGATGEGGGQIFRSSLTLSMCSGKPVRIINIRAKRKKPGLLRQHLACLKAAKEISNATVIGEEIGSTEVSFYPEKVRSGHYRFVVGSAGSTVLIFQTVMLPLAFAEGESNLTFEGGTHNGLSPSYDFLVGSFLPEMEKIGLNIKTDLVQHGFNPQGGGIWNAKISPCTEFKRYELLKRGPLIANTAVATSAKIPHHIGERELKRVQAKLNWQDKELKHKIVNSVGPGNTLSLKAKFDQVTTMVEFNGEVGVRAEKVAERTVKIFNNTLATGAPVCEHLADQLLLPLALTEGGEFITQMPSEHTTTNASVIGQFLGKEPSIKHLEEQKWRVVIG